LDAVPGNLPVQTTSFVGRELAVKEVAEQVRAHRLVTLTGVGGVGKTRLALQVAAELTGEFPDGVWLVELAPVGDPVAVPDVVATALGVTSQAGLTVTESLAQARSGRRLLLVLDNCEHVLGAAGDVVETTLTDTAMVTVLATSREGLRLPAERLWPVPLDIAGGATSAAVELFLERARAVKPDFTAGEAAEADAVAEICRRVDGIALAIELAAARMVSMSAQDVRDRLGDRFRLLSGSRRGLERHQTLRNTVQWSYDLLDDGERTVLDRCSVFAGGFDLAAAGHLCADRLDEYNVLDRLDSLVRKSLVIAEPVAGHARYGILETIRQFANEQLAVTDSTNAVRDGHAHYFADQAVAICDIWAGPHQRVAIDWVDVEYANLRVGFRWAADQGDVDTAAAIAAHTTLLGCMLMRYESIGWAAEILDAATAADVRHLPRLYTAASACSQIGRPHEAVEYAHTAVVLATDPRYAPFEPGISGWWEAAANVYAGQWNQVLDVDAGLVGQPGLAHVVGLVGMTIILPVLGRVPEALALAEEAVTAARAQGNPCWIAASLYAFGRAFADADPTRARDAMREALVVTRDHRLVQWEAIVSREAAALEAVHGDLDEAFALFETAIDSLHRAGDVADIAIALADLAVLFDRLERPAIAATLYGAGRHHGDIGWVTQLPDVVNHLRMVLGDAGFEDRAAAGAAMEFADAVAYARDQIQTARDRMVAPS
jgi:predicted ATPase